MHSYISSLDLQGPQGKLNNVFYPALGSSPKPLLIFAHGFPGHEKNFTLAQDLRDHGFHVLIFFFSGCWGSEGQFSFKNSIEDLDAVLDYILTHPQGAVAEGKSWTLDPDNLYILGHSSGCTPAAKAALRQDVRGCIFLMPVDLGALYLSGDRNMPLVLEEGLHFMNGPSMEELIGEIAKEPERFSFRPIFNQLACKHVLWISGKRDQISDERHFTMPYRMMVAERKDSLIEWRSLRTDHYYSNARPQVVFEIARFLMRTLRTQRERFSAEMFPEVFSHYLETQFPTASLQGAADWFGISVSYLSRLIREHFGESFSVMLLRTRMNQSIELLQFTDMSLTEISEFLGYTDPSYFMKVFKKFYGVTPTEYKRTCDDPFSE